MSNLAIDDDRTPARPSAFLGEPAAVVVLDVDVAEAHLANPVVAVSRILTSECRLFCRVSGDDHHLWIEIALPDERPDAATTAEAWARWALHIAGVRGTVRRIARPLTRTPA